MKKMIKLISLTLMMSLLSVLFVVAPALSEDASTNTSAVNIRTSASTSATLVGQVAKGTTLSVLEQVTGELHKGSNIWLKVRVIKCASGSKHNIDGQTGYVSSVYVTGYSGGGTGGETGGGGSVPTPTAALKIGYIKLSSGTVNVRSGNGTKYSSIAQYSTKTLVLYHNQEYASNGTDTNKWIKITHPTTGWIASQYIVAGGNIGSPAANTGKCPSCQKTLSRDTCLSITYVNTGKAGQAYGQIYYPATARYNYACYGTSHTSGMTIDGPQVDGYVWSNSTGTYNANEFHAGSLP